MTEWWQVAIALFALMIPVLLVCIDLIDKRRSRPVLPTPTLASIMRERSMRRELELADWDAEFSVASHEAKHGVTLATEGYPCSVNGKPCPCGFDSPDCR